MLIGPLVVNERGVPVGYMSGSRGSAMFLTGVIGNGTGLPLCGYEVPECRWRNAVIEATGSRTSIFTSSAPGREPAVVTSRQSMVDPARSPEAANLTASARSSVQVSCDAK